MSEEGQVERIDSEVAKHIAEVLGGFYSGGDISRSFRRSGLDDMHHEGYTKWRRIDDAFDAKMLEPGGLAKVFSFIEICMNPVKFIGRDDMFDGMRSSIDEALHYAGYMLGTDGKIFKVAEVGPNETSGGRSHEMRVRPLWGASEAKVDSQSCFVLMAFTVELDRVYQSIVKLSIEGEGFIVTRADDIHGNTGIMADIWISICRARLIVADLTARNPNVFYELGIANTVGKDVIMIAQQEDTSIPFDISHIRQIRYRNDASGGVQLGADLKQTIETVMKSK